MSLVTLRMQRVGTCETQPNMITAANALPRRPASNSSITHVIDTSRMGGRNILRLAGLPNYVYLDLDKNVSAMYTPISRAAVRVLLVWSICQLPAENPRVRVIRLSCELPYAV